MAQPFEGVTAEWIFQGMAGAVVGVGIMILILAKWGSKLFGGEKGERGIQGIQGNPGPCPYAQEHPKLQEFMGASTQDRADMRRFLEGINNKVDEVNSDTKEMKGKLDMILKSARVQWNEGR